MKKILRKWLGITSIEKDIKDLFEFKESEEIESLVAIQGAKIDKAKHETMCILADPKTKITRDWDLQEEHISYLARRGKDSVLVTHWWNMLCGGASCVTQFAEEQASFDGILAQEAYEYAQKTFNARGK